LKVARAHDRPDLDEHDRAAQRREPMRQISPTRARTDDHELAVIDDRAGVVVKL
jgi:hypothetical protein